MKRVFLFIIPVIILIIFPFLTTMKTDAEPAVPSIAPMIDGTNEFIQNTALEKEQLLPRTAKVAVETYRYEKRLSTRYNATPVEEAFSADGKRTAFLTFDDGPSKNITPQILDILKKYNVKATFFVIGRMAEDNKGLLKRISKEGHAIGNHTYSHDYRYIYDNTDNLMEDMDKCDRVLKDILGQDFYTRLFRFPGGTFGEKCRPFEEAVEKEGYRYIDWNALNGDAEGISIPGANLMKRFLDTVGCKNHIVVLMHDAGGKKTTVEMLPKAIEYLKSQGYEFRTLS